MGNISRDAAAGLTRTRRWQRPRASYRSSSGCGSGIRISGGWVRRDRPECAPGCAGAPAKDRGTWKEEEASVLTKERVQAAEELRCMIMLAADVGKMDQLMADDMVWVHGSGVIDDKASMIGKFGRGEMRYHALSRSDFEIRLFGDTAIAIGLMEIDGEAGGVRKTLHNRFMSVWVLRDDQVRLAGWQSARTG
jgi:ketosteroid isomerase-like protein